MDYILVGLSTVLTYNDCGNEILFWVTSGISERENSFSKNSPVSVMVIRFVAEPTSK